MATIKLLRNGVKKVSNRRRRKTTKRRNPIAKVANKRRRRRNPSTATSPVLKRSNGVKRVSNRRRRHSKRRNGAVIRRSNGFFGNSKEQVVSVVSLLAGLVATKVEGQIAAPIAANLLGMVGLSNYSEAVVQAAAAVTVNKWAADAIKRGSGKYVMLGGLAMAVMSAVEQMFPQLSTYNPFASVMTTPLVLNQPIIAQPNALKAAAGVPAMAGLRRPVTRGVRPLF